MPIRFVCLACGKQLISKENKAGRRTRCPGCGDILTVPSPGLSSDVNSVFEKLDLQTILAPPLVKANTARKSTENGPAAAGHHGSHSGIMPTNTKTPLVQAAPPISQSTGIGLKGGLRPATWVSIGSGIVAVLALVVALVLNRGGKSEGPADHEHDNNAELSLPAGSGKELLPRALSADAIFALASPSVVRIEILDRESRQFSQGSGFVISEEGLIATNHHVIQGGSSGEVIFGDGSKYPIVAVAGYDLESDLALLKIKGRKLPALVLEANELIPIGTKVFAIGSPIGLTNSLSEGLASGHRKMNGSLTLLQTTAPISHGSSGGPLLSDKGKVLGITTLSFSEGQNLNFAVPAQRIAKLIAAKKEYTTLAEAGSQGMRKAEERPKELPTAPKSASWSKEEKENIGHFFCAMKCQQEAYNLFFDALKDNKKNTPGQASALEAALKEASEEAALVKPKALANPRQICW